ncbi:vesicular transport-associated repeat protein [Trypanosoma rangeli]|uniref:Vesicular transport-associated repeat protein n=1 Tax=Trypanosoma rangeli TaxID=5698 RepID=A0A3R7M1Y7_TRYRA|nr:vesicular transport-associated repeat protein [Trypanosoma rangeli]RNF07546.1 vesicular transport-associated repeat protein [Trypanosoma rangeli]|eukprot:RNF07546.1 vesicular transport-associated repeat protein [Trypanosoma rangeli]
MADAAAASTVRDYKALFSAAMPPVLRSHTGMSSALLKPMPTTPETGSSSGLVCSTYCLGDLDGCGLAVGRPLLGGGSCATLHTRQMSAGLLRREIFLRGEFDRLRHAEEERMRWDHQREREARLTEERQRMLETAKAIELERVKRTEEQQQRILVQERELEEWKNERAKEVEEQRRRRMEEEERLRARQHERDMLLLREEAEVRLQTRKSLDDHKQSIESAVKSAAELMLARLWKEFKEVEVQWVTRFEHLQLELNSGTAALRHDIECERKFVTGGEAQLAETRAQLGKLLEQLEELRRQKDIDAHNRATETSLTEIHQKTIERLQRAFEEDKQSTKQWFMEEQQRTKDSHERALLEMEENHRGQLRRLEATLDESKRQLREMEAEVQQYKVKLATAALKPSSAAADEVRLREELRAVRKQLNEAVDARQRAERQSHELERECDDGRNALQALQLDMDTETARHEVELRLLREESEKLMNELTRARAAHAEELQELRKKQRSSESAVSRDAAKEVDATIRRMTERHEEARRALEAEKAQLMQKLREAEQRHEDSQRRQELELDELKGARRDSERLKQQLDEKDRVVTEQQKTIEELKRKDVSVADVTAQNRKMQQELEQLRRDHEAATRVKDKELHDLRRDASDARRRNVALQDELTAAQRTRGEVEVQMRRLVDEASLKEKQLRREAEESTQTAQSWKDRYTQLQTHSASSAPKMQTLLNEKETELALLRDTIDALKRDRDTLEKRVQELQTHSITREQEILDQATTVKGLNAEVAALREQLSATLRSTKEVSARYPLQPMEHSPFPRAIDTDTSAGARLAQPTSTVEACNSGNLRFASTGPPPVSQTTRSASDFSSVFSAPAESTVLRGTSVGSPSQLLAADISSTPRSSTVVLPARPPEGLTSSAGCPSSSLTRGSLPGMPSTGAGVLNVGAHASAPSSSPSSPQVSNFAAISQSSSLTVPVPSATSTVTTVSLAQAVVPVPVPVQVPANAASLVSSGGTSAIPVPVPLPIPNPAAGASSLQVVPRTSAAIPVPIPVPTASMATSTFSGN